MNIDMHVHTKVSSPCSCIDIYEMIEYARHIGLDAVCVTDHDTLYGAELALKVGKEKGFPVFRGMEVNTYEGDFLVFGLKKDIKRTVSARELLRIVALESGAAVVAHPYRQFKRALGNKIYSLIGYDAIEVKNGNTPVRYNKLAQMAAVDLNMPGIGGSDAHQVEEIGRYYTKFKADITTEQELIKAIKTGSYEARTSLRNFLSLYHNLKHKQTSALGRI